MNLENRKLPPLNAIVTFEATARWMSFTRAAQELHLSQSAVSRQVQGLEHNLGVPLFQRRHKELELTRAGAIFQKVVSDCLADLRRAVRDIENLSSSSVTISASLGMASFCLMPAILQFREKHPKIAIKVIADDGIADPRREPIDFAIRYGDGNWPGLTAVKLFEEEVFPVCSPDYLQRRGISAVSDLSKEALIDFDGSISRYGSWSGWLTKAKLGQPLLNIGMTLSNYDLVYRAICAGKGIGLTWSYVIPQEVRDKVLVRPIDTVVTTGMGEYLVYPAESQLGEAAIAVLDWLTAYARQSAWK